MTLLLYQTVLCHPSFHPHPTTPPHHPPSPSASPLPGKRGQQISLLWAWSGAHGGGHLDGPQSVRLEFPGTPLAPGPLSAVEEAAIVPAPVSGGNWLK